jgi:hypothetical protein
MSYTYCTGVVQCSEIQIFIRDVYHSYTIQVYSLVWPMHNYGWPNLAPIVCGHHDHSILLHTGQGVPTKQEQYSEFSHLGCHKIAHESVLRARRSSFSLGVFAKAVPGISDEHNNGMLAGTYQFME